MNNLIRISVIIAAILLLSCSSEANDQEKDTTKTNETAKTKEENKKSNETTEPGISLENYNRVKDGMDLSTVEKFLGKDHYKVSTSRSGDEKTETYTWSDGPKTISITFVGGKLEYKVKAGL